MIKKEVIKAEYKIVEPYLETPLEAREERCVLLIAAAIAAGISPKSQFKIKSIKKENPIYKKVSIITTSIAAGERKYSYFKIKEIRKI